jgi:hypothetical protein
MVTIGREDCDIVIPHPKVSRRHLDIRNECNTGSGDFVLIDRSTNGTVVNKEKVHNREIFIPSYAHSSCPPLPKILLAGEVELKWEDVKAAFTKKQGTTKPPVSTAPPTPKLTPPPQASKNKNAKNWLIAVGVLILILIIISIANS